MSDKVRAIPLIQFMFDEYNLKIKDKPTYIFEKFKESGYEQPKRKPLPDGVLPMTESELEEFGEIVHTQLKNLKVKYDRYVECITYEGKGESGKTGAGLLYNIKAILYLANLFDLTGV